MKSRPGAALFSHSVFLPSFDDCCSDIIPYLIDQARSSTTPFKWQGEARWLLFLSFSFASSFQWLLQYDDTVADWLSRTPQLFAVDEKVKARRFPFLAFSLASSLQWLLQYDDTVADWSSIEAQMISWDDSVEVQWVHFLSLPHFKDYWSTLILLLSDRAKKLKSLLSMMRSSLSDHLLISHVL